MKGPFPPWNNVLVRYCPHCRLVYPPNAEQCPRCRRPLIDQVQREKVDER